MLWLRFGAHTTAFCFCFFPFPFYLFFCLAPFPCYYYCLSVYFAVYTLQFTVQSSVCIQTMTQLSTQYDTQKNLTHTGAIKLCKTTRIFVNVFLFESTEITVDFVWLISTNAPTIWILSRSFSFKKLSADFCDSYVAPANR